MPYLIMWVGTQGNAVPRPER